VRRSLERSSSGVSRRTISTRAGAPPRGRRAQAPARGAARRQLEPRPQLVTRSLLRCAVAVAQTRGIAPSLLVSPTEAVRTGPPPRYRWILVSPSAARLDYRCRPLQRPGFVQQPRRHAGVRRGRRLACANRGGRCTNAVGERFRGSGWVRAFLRSARRLPRRGRGGRLGPPPAQRGREARLVRERRRRRGWRPAAGSERTASPSGEAMRTDCGRRS
jgi:hypothetical protein